jgi:hypothetical protein
VTSGRAGQLGGLETLYYWAQGESSGPNMAGNGMATPVGREGARRGEEREQRQRSDGSRCVCCFVSSCLVSCWAGSSRALCHCARPSVSARRIRCGCGCDLAMRGGKNKTREN